MTRVFDANAAHHRQVSRFAQVAQTGYLGAMSSTQATPTPVSIRVGGAHGLSLHALEWSKEGVPLVLLHGFSNEAHIWDDVAPIVAPYYRTLAFDLRGHGDSDRDAERRYEYDAHVADLEEATAALGIERMVLVGHSFGGRVAMFFAGRHPERVAGLVIVDSGPEHDPRGSLRIRLENESREGGGGVRAACVPDRS